MAEEIINRVANSQLMTVDLEDFYPEGKRIVFDIKKWLFEEQILKEKNFRAFVAQHDWKQYQDNYIALYCSVDAIVPGWAYILIATQLNPFAKKVIHGDLAALETAIYQLIIENLDLSKYRGKRVVIKGCSKRPVPSNAYIFLTAKLQPLVKSLMYGEACSSVPLLKN